VERRTTEKALAYRPRIETYAHARIERGQANLAWPSMHQIAAALDVSRVASAARVVVR